ncbi:MAG TPA: hypothetical protein VGM21_04025 [Actinomycetota bacterium]|jgi:hypothetical protein
MTPAELRAAQAEAGRILRQADERPARAPVAVAGFTIHVAGGRVWLHRTGGGDGDLTAAEAQALAAALTAAAAQAIRMGRRAR